MRGLSETFLKKTKNNIFFCMEISNFFCHELIISRLSEILILEGWDGFGPARRPQSPPPIVEAEEPAFSFSQHMRESLVAPGTEVAYHKSFRMLESWLLRNRPELAHPQDPNFVDLRQVTSAHVQSFLDVWLPEEDRAADAEPPDSPAAATAASAAARAASARAAATPGSTGVPPPPVDFSGLVLRVSASAMNIMRCAIKFVFKKRRVQLPEGLEVFLSEVLGGIRRYHRRAQPRVEGGQDTAGISGKSPLPFEIYRKVASAMLLSEKPQDLWAHLYGVLTWNLMCRTNNTESLDVSMVQVSGDSIAFRFLKVKNDQTGERLKDRITSLRTPSCPRSVLILPWDLRSCTLAAAARASCFRGPRSPRASPASFRRC
jgi:hypothetical protein